MGSVWRLGERHKNRDAKRDGSLGLSRQTVLRLMKNIELVDSIENSGANPRATGFKEQFDKSRRQTVTQQALLRLAFRSKCQTDSSYGFWCLLEEETGVDEFILEDWKQEILALYQQETERLKAIARAEVDDFWITHYKVRETEPFKQWGLLGVRIRDFKYGFGIEWYINRFHGQKGNRVVFSKSLRLSRTNMSYSFMDCQGRAKEWEILLALEKEQVFSEIRRNLVKLTKMRRTLSSYGLDWDKPAT